MEARIVAGCEEGPLIDSALSGQSRCCEASELYGVFASLCRGHSMLLHLLPSRAVGRPIDVMKVEHPTQAQVIALRDAYLVALEALFDEHKVNYGFNSEQKLRFT